MIDEKHETSRTLTEVTYIELLDVQGLFGGRNVCVSRNGTAWVQTVRPREGKRRLFEKQYVLILSGEELQNIRQAVVESDFFSLKSEERFGVPDEARPEIVVTKSDGTPLHSVAVWEKCMLPPDAYQNSDRHKFDKVYTQLRRLEVVAAERAAPVHKATYKGPDSWRSFKKKHPKTD